MADMSRSATVPNKSFQEHQGDSHKLPSKSCSQPSSLERLETDMNASSHSKSVDDTWSKKQHCANQSDDDHTSSSFSNGAFVNLTTEDPEISDQGELSHHHTGCQIEVESSKRSNEYSETVTLSLFQEGKNGFLKDGDDDDQVERIISPSKSQKGEELCRNGDVLKQPHGTGSFAKKGILNNVQRNPKDMADALQKSQLEVKEQSFLSPVSTCTESDSESETETENRLRAALEVLLFPTDELELDDARQALNQIRGSLRSGKKSRKKRLERFLREIYRSMKDFEESQDVQERACVILGKIARDVPSTQEIIAATGGVKHIMEAMTRHKECETVQDKGIYVLLSLTENSIARGHIVAQRGAECVSWAMSEFQDIRPILTNGSATLCNLAFASEEGKTRIGKVGGILAIVNAMNRHQTDADLQSRCCLALRNLTGGSGANQWIAGRAFAMEVIVKCMKAFPREVSVQYQGCAALANICSKETENRERATSIEVMETCMAAMRSNTDHMGLIEHGLLVLRNICIGHSENQLRVGAADGIELILDTLKRYRLNEKILVKACSALRFLLFSRSNRETLFSCKGLEQLIRVLRDGEFVRDVAENAILALANATFDHAEGKRLVGRYGGIAALVDVMSKHVDSETVQDYGCRALRNLADSDEINTRLLGDSGAVNTAIVAMMGYPNNSAIQEHACAMLFNMAFSEHNIRIMQELQVVGVIENVADFHQGVGIQCQAKALITMLKPQEASSSPAMQLSKRSSLLSSTARNRSPTDFRTTAVGGAVSRMRSEQRPSRKATRIRSGCET